MKLDKSIIRVMDSKLLIYKHKRKLKIMETTVMYYTGVCGPKMYINILAVVTGRFTKGFKKKLTL